MSEQAKPTGRASKSDVAHIVANPMLYGFQWRKHPLNKDGMELPLHATATEVTDFARFREAFGDDLISNALDGTSLKVQEDTVCRNLRWKERSVSTQEQREQVVLRVLLGESAQRGGVKIVTKEVVTYADMKGVTHATLLEAQAANIGYCVDAGMSVEQAKAMQGIG